MAPLGQHLLELVAGFVLFSVVFRVLQMSLPRHRRLPIIRKGFLVDLTYFALGPLISKMVDAILALTVVVPIALIAHGSLASSDIMGGFGPLSRWPYWVQALAILILGDFCGYWTHRAFHRPYLWGFHAVHHSSVDLDWLAGLRTHPINDVIQRIIPTLPTLALGFAPAAIASVLPVFAVFAIALHANLDWDWGPLRRVIASPRFHRWHHALEEEAQGKNFAGLFPLWDILFGTFYLPSGRVPSRFGTVDPVPSSFVAQMSYPFHHGQGGAHQRSAGTSGDC